MDWLVDYEVGAWSVGHCACLCRSGGDGIRRAASMMCARMVSSTVVVDCSFVR